LGGVFEHFEVEKRIRRREQVERTKKKKIPFRRGGTTARAHRPPCSPEKTTGLLAGF